MAVPRRTTAAKVAVTAPALLAALVLAACSSSTGPHNPVVDNSSTTGTTTTSTGAPGTCSYPAHGTAARAVGTPSTTNLLAPKTLTLHLAVGPDKTAEDIVIALDPATAPCTVNSIAYLANKKYYDDTQCHRLTTNGIHILQCGDPTATGSGGPGYSFADELSGTETYPVGTVAMANAGPNTNGSQFFLVYGLTPLQANYTIFGKITSGVTDIVRIAHAGADNTEGSGNGRPVESVRIVSAVTS